MLCDIETANPSGEVYIITENLSSHDSKATRTWLQDHPRLHQVFIPKGACWLNLQEGWWRLYRRDAHAGQPFADAEEIERATTVATGPVESSSQALGLGTTSEDTSPSSQTFCYRI